VYCRPICPARAPKDANVRYFPTAAAAELAGFRPCLRCRPEASPGTPAWLGTSGVVSRGLRLISEGMLDQEGVDRFAERLGVSARHLRRLFLRHLGATPLDVALTRRVHFAKKLLDETTLRASEVAFAAGFGSVRRFNSEIRRTYGRTPTELRRLAYRHAPTEPGSYRIRLAYRPPYDWDGLLNFLRARATPGVEHVDADVYRRTILVGETAGSIEVSRTEDRPSLTLAVQFPDSRFLLTIVERVRRMFDLGADPVVIAQHLGADRLLRPFVVRYPGIRTPGTWDGFELAVRAIIGQQISVAAATTIAGRIASTFGSPLPSNAFPLSLDADPTPVQSGLGRLFPTPAQLATADLESAGLMPSRAQTIRNLASHVASGTIAINSFGDRSGAVEGLETIPGIGRWTTEYIAMRALGGPDAFPAGDLVLRRMAGNCSARELDDRSRAWKPWRAYAVMLLWRAATDQQRREKLKGAPKIRVRNTGGRVRRVSRRVAAVCADEGRPGRQTRSAANAETDDTLRGLRALIPR
jgi:AraC family transcriptional regulator of adaptative response / DNA-3-methyladenine glycosylase II